MPHLCFVAGDPSGDAHAARLIDALKTHPSPWTFTGLGGPAMQRAGAVLLDDLTKASAIGPFDAVRYLGRFTRARRLLNDHLTAQRPDLVILVDFGDFNLPVIAPLVKRHKLPILYYISPQVWAWGRFRLRLIRRHVDRMVVFFPFEETLYKAAGVPVTWVGHPLVEAARPTLDKIEAARRAGLNPWRRTVGLLPGSREHEVDRHLPLMLAAARAIAWRLPGVQFLLAQAPSVAAAWLNRHLDRAGCDVRVASPAIGPRPTAVDPPVSSPEAGGRDVAPRGADVTTPPPPVGLHGSVYDALQLMDAAMVASGTATLDAALCRVPMVVVYRASWPTYAVARAVIRVPSIALVNVVAGGPIVPELIQHRATPTRLAEAMMELLRDDEKAEAMRKELDAVKAKLGPPGAVTRAASAVLELLSSQPSAISHQPQRSSY